MEMSVWISYVNLNAEDKHEFGVNNMLIHFKSGFFNDQGCYIETC